MFTYLNESASRIKLKQLCKSSVNEVLKESTQMAPMDSIKFGINPYNRALNFYDFNNNMKKHKDVSKEDFLNVCKYSYPDESPEDIVKFFGTHNYTKLLNILDFWPNTPVTLDSALEEVGKKAYSAKEDIIIFTERLKSAPLDGLTSQASRVFGFHREAGYSSLYLLSMDVILGVHYA